MGCCASSQSPTTPVRSNKTLRKDDSVLQSQLDSWASKLRQQLEKDQPIGCFEYREIESFLQQCVEGLTYDNASVLASESSAAATRTLGCIYLATVLLTSAGDKYASEKLDWDMTDSILKFVSGVFTGIIGVDHSDDSSRYSIVISPVLDGIKESFVLLDIVLNCLNLCHLYFRLLGYGVSDASWSSVVATIIAILNFALRVQTADLKLHVDCFRLFFIVLNYRSITSALFNEYSLLFSLHHAKLLLICNSDDVCNRVIVVCILCKLIETIHDSSLTISNPAAALVYLEIIEALLQSSHSVVEWAPIYVAIASRFCSTQDDLVRRRFVKALVRSTFLPALVSHLQATTEFIFCSEVLKQTSPELVSYFDDQGDKLSVNAVIWSMIRILCEFVSFSQEAQMKVLNSGCIVFLVSLLSSRSFSFDTLIPYVCCVNLGLALDATHFVDKDNDYKLIKVIHSGELEFAAAYGSRVLTERLADTLSLFERSSEDGADLNCLEFITVASSFLASLSLHHLFMKDVVASHGLLLLIRISRSNRKEIRDAASAALTALTLLSVELYGPSEKKKFVDIENLSIFDDFSDVFCDLHQAICHRRNVDAMRLCDKIETFALAPDSLLHASVAYIRCFLKARLGSSDADIEENLNSAIKLGFSYSAQFNSDQELATFRQHNVETTAKLISKMEQQNTSIRAKIDNIYKNNGGRKLGYTSMWGNQK